MDFEESIYNLIPKEAYVPPKQPRHISRHNPLSFPTSSSFNLKTTSKPGVSNMAGHDHPNTGDHTHKANGATFGLAKGAAKPDSSKFRLKNTGTIVIPDGKLSVIIKEISIDWTTEIQNRIYLSTTVTIFKILTFNLFFSYQIQQRWQQKSSSTIKG